MFYKLICTCKSLSQGCRRPKWPAHKYKMLYQPRTSKNLHWKTDFQNKVICKVLRRAGMEEITG